MPTYVWKNAAVAVAAVTMAVLAAPEHGSAAGPLCAFHQSTTSSGTVATATFRIVRDDCEVSLVAISKFADGNAIFDTATGVFAAREAYYTMTVSLPCDQGSETDLVLGPPTLYPPAEFDLQATRFDIVCPASGGGGSSSGGGSSGGGGTSGTGEGSPGAGASGDPLPDLTSTITSSKTKGVRIGDTLNVTVTVTNKGKGAAGAVHVLITPSVNLIHRGMAVASRGPGCSGSGVIDCNLGSLPAGDTTTVRLRLKAASGRKLFISAVPQRSQPDATPADDVGTLTIKLLPRPVRFTIAAVAGRIAAGEQYAFVKLSSRGALTAQVYLGGVAQPIVWRRTLAAGTSPVRIPLPKLAKGQRFTIVVRATSGKSKASTKLKLIA